MKKIMIIVTLISAFLAGCHMNLNRKDYKIKLKDFDWNTNIEGNCGEIYIKGSNFIFGRNYDSTFIEISSTNGAVLDTLKSYTVEQERECTILDKAGVYENGYSLHNVPVDKKKYQKVTLKIFDRQYRGDEETYYLIIKSIANPEFIILFDRKQFPSINDITYFKDGKFIVTYNAIAGYDQHKYSVYVGLFDLEKIIKK
ncbi:MAG: hypothetical protein NTW31_13370 [Bacteroidetes bacterium]|nr:hypothetical protein [Bacteroidota bacterium]